VWCWPTGYTTLVIALKQKICFKPILSIFKPKLPLIVYTDASRDGYAGTFVQLSDNREKPIAFFSKQITSPEKNYHSFELKLLAIITNCNAVKNALTKQTISPRADDEFGEGILGNQKLKKMYYLNVSESGIDSR
jgi:hypothetical protein